MFVYAPKAARSFIQTQCKVVRLQESTGPASCMIKYGLFTVLYLTAIKCGSGGKGQ